MNTFWLAQILPSFPPPYKDGFPSEPGIPDAITDGMGPVMLVIMACLAFVVLPAFLLREHRNRVPRVHRERAFPRYPVLPKTHRHHHRRRRKKSAAIV